MKLSRRNFIRLSSASAMALYVRTAGGGFLKLAQLAIPGGSLAPGDIPKFDRALPKPPVMPLTARGRGRRADFYNIRVAQFQQQILSGPYPATTVWSYGAANSPRTALEGGSYFYPAFTIETQWNRPIRVNWINGLVDGNGNFLPHLLPVDPTLHWANPPGGLAGRDSRPQFTGTPGPYTGPVPIITHVHGAHAHEQFDGYAEAWYLPDAANIPVGYARTGTFFDYFSAKYGLDWGPGSAMFEYPNDQRATTLWYHDHTLGMTRQNVYAGPAGFYLIRGGPDDVVLDSRDGSTAILPGPAPGVGANPFDSFYEIPMAIQDRSFNADGSLFYPDNRAFFEGLNVPPTIPYLDIPYIGETACDGLESDVAPLWNPEFFGNMIVVNGFTWPFLEVEQRRYRLRLLNGCNSRFLILDFSDATGIEVWQIGSDGGFLLAPVNLTETSGSQVLLGPAERADIIVDFSQVTMGSYLLRNLGPDEPFGGGVPGEDFDVADPQSTGQVLEFRVVPATGVDNTTPPHFLQLPALSPPGNEDRVRTVSLNEEDSHSVRVTEDESGNVVLDCDGGEIFGPTAALLGTLDGGNGNPTPLLWSDPVTENPNVGETEVWEMYNFTEDAHPIHIHLVQFEVLEREVLNENSPHFPQFAAGATVPREVWETGPKDTVIAYPGEITRVKARFDLPGFYVWHCHILEHEDNEMMRPYHVGPIPPDAPSQ